MLVNNMRFFKEIVIDSRDKKDMVETRRSDSLKNIVKSQIDILEDLRST